MKTQTLNPFRIPLVSQLHQQSGQREYSFIEILKQTSGLIVMFRVTNIDWVFLAVGSYSKSFLKYKATENLL